MSHRRLLPLVLLVLASASPAGATEVLGELARARHLASEVSFEPLIEATSWRLIVSGPEDFRFEKDVPPGVSPTISVADIEAVAGTVPPGVYAYDLVARFDQRPGGHRRVQFGYFSIRDGAILTSDAYEPVAGTAVGGGPVAPQVIPEDLAVQGDLCAGSSECTAADVSFFQIIRIKGDNPRLEFSDTSTTVNFPTNDWQLTSGGSTSGSAEFFGITDAGTGNHVLVVEPGAPANTVYLEGDGDVGLGTMSPATRLHVAGDATIDGDLSVLSSRSAKHDLEPVSHDEILAALERLSIHKWRYRDDPRQARHLGPTAEQFHQLFGVGADPGHLSPVDAAGVALAAAQRLQRLVVEQGTALAGLRAERDQLLRRLDDLEARLDLAVGARRESVSLQRAGPGE